MNKTIILLAILVLPIALVAGCVNEPIGGQRDEHGCLTPAGYSWDEEVGACVRSWELDDNQKQVAKTAVDYVGYEYATTITEVLAKDCDGCFEVKLEQGEDRNMITVEIEDMTAISKTVARHICTEEEKQAEICYMLYFPVCGYKTDGSSMTYGNDCQACADKVEYWEAGECPA